LYMLLHLLVVEEGLREPFRARDWLKTYGQGPCGTLTIALSPCGQVALRATAWSLRSHHLVSLALSTQPGSLIWSDIQHYDF